MKIKKERLDDYNLFVAANNSDCYGQATMSYMHKWADMMEEEVLAGKSVAEAATKTQFTADTEGITGFMYEYAVRVMSQVWEHGEELRVWHNANCGYSREGIANSAILVIV